MTGISKRAPIDGYQPASTKTDELKARHPQIPWSKVAGIGNILRHEYAGVSAPVMWKLVQEDLTPLEQVCREELAREQAGEGRI